MSWKESQAARIAAVQCGGVGRDRYLWGRKHGSAGMTIMCSTRPLGLVSQPSRMVHNMLQDLGRYAVLEHAWAVGVAIAFVRIFSVTALMYNEILSGRGLLGMVR